MHPSRQRKPFAINMVQGFVNVDEQTYVTREDKQHGPEIPKDLVPVFDADLLLVVGIWQIGFP